MSEATKATVSAAAVIVVNLAMYAFGVNLDQTIVTQVIGGAVIIATTLYAAWKNHNFTKAAQQGQLVTNRIKNEERAIALKEEDDE